MVNFSYQIQRYSTIYTLTLTLMLQPGDSPKHQPKVVGATLVDPKQSPAANFPPGSAEAQLKYENDRLKLALAQR